MIGRYYYILSGTNTVQLDPKRVVRVLAVVRNRGAQITNHQRMDAHMLLCDMLEPINIVETLESPPQIYITYATQIQMNDATGSAEKVLNVHGLPMATLDAAIMFARLNHP